MSVTEIHTIVPPKLHAQTQKDPLTVNVMTVMKEMVCSAGVSEQINLKIQSYRCKTACTKNLYCNCFQISTNVVQVTQMVVVVISASTHLGHEFAYVSEVKVKDNSSEAIFLIISI